MGRKNDVACAFDVSFSVLHMFHHQNFAIDRPKGLSDEYLFLHFLAPARMALRKRILKLPPGSCFIYAPGEPQLYCGDGLGLGNDAFHFSGGEALGMLRKYGIPLNTPLLPSETWRIADIVSEIHREYTSRSKQSPDVFEALFRLLCIELSRRLSDSISEPLSPRAREIRSRLRAVRLAMLSRLGESWDIRRLAKDAGIGRSRFCALYSSLFGRAPIEELIDARVEMSKRLLSGGNCTVAEASGLCGFSSPQYFCRVFRARTGKTPGSFR